MDFVHIGLLPYFLPLAAIPIVLHLITLHRLKTVELSTFRFLFDSYVQQRRRMKFLEALIAFLRTLFLLLLVLMIARPVVRHWNALFGAGGGREIVMLVDGSASMNASTDGVTALARAKRAATAVVERLGADDRVTLIRVGAKPEEVFRRYSSDSQSITQRIEGLSAGPSRANFFAAFRHLFGPQAAALKKPIVHIFTDCQQSGWREFQEETIEGLLPDDTEIMVVNVGAGKETPNRAVVGAAPREHRAIAGLPITLRPKVVAHALEEPEDVYVNVIVNERQVARTPLTLRSGQTAQAEIVFTPATPGVLKCRFEIAADQFTDDDAFLFTLNVQPQLEVLLVNGSPSADPLQDAGLYVRAALRSPLHDSPSRDFSTRRVEQQLQLREVPEAQVNDETLRTARVVILANCGKLNPPQFQKLRSFVRKGGGLIILPGDKVNPEVYNKQFFPVPNVADQRLVAVEMAPPEGDPNNAPAAHFGEVDFLHPVLSVFEANQSQYFTGVQVFRHFPLKTAVGPNAPWRLIAFNDGDPALVENPFGDGRVLLAAFAPDSRWSNLPLKPEFVPLLLRMVGHIKHRQELEGPSVVAADGVAELVVDQQWAPVQGKVQDAAGKTAQLSFERSQSRLVAAFERTVDKGYYTATVSGGNSQQAKLAFAVNLDASESDFQSLGKKEATGLFPGAQVTYVDASAQAQQAHGSIGDQREIWRPLIFLMLVIIGIEFMISTWGGSTTAPGQPLTFGQRMRRLSPNMWLGRMTGVESESEETASEETAA